MSVYRHNACYPLFLRVQSYKKLLMSIYVLIIKADNTGKIGIYRFFREITMS